MLMQYSADTPPPLWVDTSLDLVVSHPFQPTVVLMQDSTDITPIFGGDASLNLVVSHPIQPMVEEVVMPMILVICLLYHVLNISSPAPSEQERVLISPGTLPPSVGEIPFEWDGLVGYPIHSFMPFQVRGILRYIFFRTL
jgi:hypothetical protein